MPAKYDAVQGGKGKSSAVAIVEEEDDDDDADLGPDDWDDILSAWMSAVGLTDMLKASEETETAPKSVDGGCLLASHCGMTCTTRPYNRPALRRCLFAASVA